MLVMNDSHHLSKFVIISEVRGDGQFNAVRKTPTMIRVKPWSLYISGNEGEPNEVK